MTDKPILYTYFFSSPGRAVLLTARTIGLELENRYGFILPAFKLEMIFLVLFHFIFYKFRDINIRNGDHLTPEFLKVCILR